MYVKINTVFILSVMIRKQDIYIHTYILYRNIEALSRNLCCCRKAISISYYECVLGIQHALRMRRIVICDLSGCKIFSTLSDKNTIFGKCY